MKTYVYILISILFVNWACRKADPWGIVTGYGSVIKDGEKFGLKDYSKNITVTNDTLDNIGFYIYFKERILGAVSIHQIPLSQDVIRVYTSPYDSLTYRYNRKPGYTNASYSEMCGMDCLETSKTILMDHPDNFITIEKIKKRDVYQMKFNLIFEHFKNPIAVTTDPSEERDTIYLTDGIFEFVVKE